MIMVTETWLTQKATNSLLTKDTPYTLVRSDRSSTQKGGGAAIFIKKLIPFQTIKTPKNANSDICAIDLFSPLNQQKTRFINIYRPTTNETLDDFENLTETLSELISVDFPCSIFGDFNLPNLTWSSSGFSLSKPTPTPFETTFINFVVSSGISQIITQPTRNDKFLDLVFTTQPNLLLDPRVEPPFSNSDHCSIITNINLLTKPSFSAPRFNFYKGNYDQINNILLHIDWLTFFAGTAEVDGCYNKFLSLLHELIQVYIPYFVPKSPISGYPNHIQKLFIYRSKLWKDISKPHIKIKFDQVCLKIDSEIYRFLQNRENKKFSSIKSKFDFIRSFIKPKDSHIPILVGRDQKPIFSNKLKTQALADQFSIAFSSDSISAALADSLPINTLDFIEILPNTIFEALGRLDNSNCPSPDGIPNIFLKKCRTALVSPLNYIFNSSIMSAKIPLIWKTAIIHPIPKKPNPSLPIDFRPISLLCSSSKILEKIISDKLQQFIDANNILPECQHGFRQQHSVTTQLIEVVDDITFAIDNGCSTDIIYFDLAKAFDTVPFSRLISKLANFGIGGALLNWIEDYLSNRTFTVKINNHLSKNMPCLSGVPQGSILGPLLFIIYISDLPKICSTSNVSIKLFADDLKAYISFNNSQNYSTNLQQFIIKFSDYCLTNGLKIAANKCSVLHLGNKNPKNKYFIDQFQLPSISETESVRDLGIHFTHNLKWDKHVEIITQKARRSSFALFKSIKSKNPNILINLFNIYSRSILEFSSPVFNPYLEKDISAIEKVQKSFLKNVFRRVRPGQDVPDYDSLLKLFNQESLADRRIKADLILFHKQKRGLISIKHNHSYSINTNQTRGLSGITTSFCKAKCRYQSFFFRASRLYRYLPVEIQNLNTAYFIRLLNKSDIHAILNLPPHLQKT
jgi:hypothetical protein